jgi:hypothetical protein
MIGEQPNDNKKAGPTQQASGNSIRKARIIYISIANLKCHRFRNTTANKSNFLLKKC